MKLRLVGGERTEPAWLYALAGALMLGGPFARELYFHHYPARTELFVLLLMAGGAGALVSVVAGAVRGVLGGMAFGGLLFAFADLQLDPQRWTYTAAALLACIALALLFAAHRAALTALSLGAFYLTSILRPAIAPPPLRLDVDGTGRPTVPLLVHVVLDEQWGVGGLRAAGDSVTADFLRDFYLTRGFELFGAAYSRYMATEQSLQSEMLLGDSGTGLSEGREPYNFSMRRNPYFDTLRQRGYAIHVYQSTFIDLCNGNTAVVSCEVKSGNSIANVGFLDGSWVTRGLWVSRYFLATRSHVYHRLFAGDTAWRRSAAGGGLASMRDLSGAIASHPTAGTAWFAHVLLPHRPVHADADCKVIADPSKFVGYNLPDDASDASWMATLSQYAGQVRCAHLALDEVIDAIDRTVGKDNSIVIVQGDHGSRMHRNAAHDESRPVSAFSLSELNSDFSTLLAVRRPGIPATLHREAAPVQEVIRDLVRSGFTSTMSGPWTHYVGTMTDGKRDTEIVRPLAVADMYWVRRRD